MLKLGVPQNYIINTYLGNSEYESNEDWGNFFYVELREDTPTILLSKARINEAYQHEYDTLTGSIMLIFRISDYQKDHIVTPFIKGKYSEIDRAYVREHFSQYIQGQLSFDYRILTKDKYTPSRFILIRDYWKRQIGIALPEDAEIWSIPSKEDEIYLHLSL
jgi:hypothetical protein